MEEYKTFTFIEERAHQGAYTIKEHTYICEDASTWMPIMLQFASFLEGTGYVGIYEKMEILLEDF